MFEFHPVNGTHRSGPMNAGETMDQHGMVARVLHDVEKLADIGLGGNAIIPTLIFLIGPAQVPQAEMVQTGFPAELLFLLVRSWLIGAGSKTQRHHGLDAMIVNESFEAIQRKLAAAVKNARRGRRGSCDIADVAS